MDSASRGGSRDVETTARHIDRSLAALADVDRNAHQTTLAECWLDDLASDR